MGRTSRPAERLSGRQPSATFLRFASVDFAVGVPREVVDDVVAGEPGTFLASLRVVVPRAGFAHRAQLADPGDVADDGVDLRGRRGDGDRVGVVVAGDVHPLVVRPVNGGAVMASQRRHLARPHDEGIAVRSFEEENAARGVAGRQNRPIICGTFH